MIFTTALALALAQAPAPASNANRDDVRCLIIFSLLSSGDDKDAATTGAIGVQYFLGRLDGRTPGFDLEGAMVTEATALTQPDIEALATSCGKQIETRANDLMAIGQRLEKLGQQTAN